jgi:hypothetical protein
LVLVVPLLLVHPQVFVVDTQRLVILLLGVVLVQVETTIHNGVLVLLELAAVTLD